MSRTYHLTYVDGSSKTEKRQSVRTNRHEAKQFLRLGSDYSEGHNPKEFSDCWMSKNYKSPIPLRRYLQANVGKSWEKVLHGLRQRARLFGGQFKMELNYLPHFVQFREDKVYPYWIGQKFIVDAQGRLQNK